ncbi:FtsK/SpoIIIE domain-containing protein, partial [Staphylococcus aureus]
MTIAHPDEVKFLIIDPKGNEFGNYKGLPFMLADPIIDLSQSKNALEYLANEMDYRMQLFQKHGGKK